jgi:hypothetical protein
MRTLTKIKLIIIGVISILTISILFADQALPNNVELYIVKRFQEKVFMAVKKSPVDKINYYNLLLDKRLDELVSLVKNKEYDYLYPASLRYSTTAGLLTQTIKTENSKELIYLTKNKFMDHQQKIQNLYNSCLSQEDDRCKYVQDSYNYLAIYLDQLSN